MSPRQPLSRTAKSGKMSLFYVAFLLYIEPVSALVGAYYAYFQPQTYLELTHKPSAPLFLKTPLATHVVLHQLSNLYLLFALNEALVLRATSDLRVWRTVLFVLLVADLGHLWSVKGLGIDVYWRAWEWNSMMWGNVGFVYLGALTRILFLSGIGIS